MMQAYVPCLFNTNAAHSIVSSIQSINSKCCLLSVISPTCSIGGQRSGLVWTLAATKCHELLRSNAVLRIAPRVHQKSKICNQRPQNLKNLTPQAHVSMGSGVRRYYCALVAQPLSLPQIQILSCGQKINLDDQLPPMPPDSVLGRYSTEIVPNKLRWYSL